MNRLARSLYLRPFIMYRISDEELRSVMVHLDQAIYNYTQWEKQLVRTLLCKLPFDQRDIYNNSHVSCRFGEWYYNQSPKSLRDHPAFRAIEPEHIRTHQLAATLLRASANNSQISTHDYDNFESASEHLRLEILSLKHELENSMFNMDTLTGALSRVGMLTKLREQQELSRRGVQYCSIAMMDLDHFKEINDHFGHLAGDRVLTAVSHFTIDNVRPYDYVFRYGGEEFLICMQNTNLESGQSLIDRIRQGISQLSIDMDGEKVSITASFGLTLLDPDIAVEQSVERADRAMYAAKSAGRNCVQIWNPSMTGNGTRTAA